MPGVNYGQLSGASGPIAIARINTAPGSTVVIQISELIGWEASSDSRMKMRRGRGGTAWPTYRRIFNSGNVAGTGKVQVEGPPFDPDSGGHTGSVVFQLDAGKTVTYPVTFTFVKVQQTPKTKDLWEISFSAHQSGAASFSGGWGTAPNATDPTPADLQLYEGTQFTIDTDDILTSSLVLIDWWGTVADTDAGDTGKLATVIGAAIAPYTNLKLRTGTLVRDSGVSGIGGGTISLSWGLTTVAEDIENAASQIVDDEKDLYDSQTISLVQGSVTPTPPSVPAGLKLVHTDTSEINDNNFRHTFYYRRRDYEDDVEMGGSSITDDPSDLADAIVVVEVQASNTPTPPSTPSGFVLRDTRTSQIHGASGNEKWRHEFLFSLTTHEEDITFPGTWTDDDQSDLGDTASITIVDDATPVAPSTPSGYKLVSIRSGQLTDAGLYRWTYFYARRTNQEAIEMDGTPYFTDASSLSDAITFTLVKSSGTPDAPSTPDGFVLTDYRIVQHHAASTGEKWIHAYRFGRITRGKQIEFSGTTVELNATNDLGYQSSIRVVNTNAAGADTPPSNPAGDWGIVGKLVSSRSEPLTTSQGSYTGYWQHSYFYGPNDQYDSIVNQGQYSIDPSSIGTVERIVDTDNTSTFPSTPTPSDTNLKLIARSRHRIQADPEKWQFEWHFGRNTREDELEETDRTIDPNVLGVYERIPILHTSATSSPGTPSPVGTPTTLVETNVRRVCVANSSFTGLWLWVFTFGPETRAQRIQNAGTAYVEDQSSVAIADDEVQTVVSTSITPSDPGVVNAALQLVRIRTRPIQSDPARYEHTYFYDYLTPQEKVQHGGTSATADILGSRAINSTVTEETTVKSCTSGDDVDSLLVTEVAALHAASIPWFKATVRKISKTAYELIVQRPSDDKQVNEVSGSTRWERRALDPTGVFLHVQDVFQDDGALLTRFKIGWWNIKIQRTHVILRRYFKVSTASSNRFDSLTSSRNNASFLSYDAYTVHFQSSVQQYAWGEEGGSRWIAVDIHLEVSRTRWGGVFYDGDYDTSLIPVGDWIPTASAVSVGGAYLAASYDSGWIAETDTNADYSALLA